MAIQQGDIKLVASRVMADVPEGGGGPTANIIPDGTSNAIFPDISEVDRGNGRVRVRQVFAHVQTSDVAQYLGANIIVAKPPQDPRVNITLFSTRNTFDQRTQAISRVESYLAAGSEWQGFLFENHIAGQKSLSIFQRPNTPTPPSGKTLMLVKNEGQVGEVIQYVRVLNVSTVSGTYTDINGQDFQGTVVTCELANALEFDFPGTPPNRRFQRDPAGSRIRDTLVADAARYFSVTPLVAQANLGALSADVESVYTQLVPSAQTETAILDATPSQNVLGLQPSSANTITLTTSVSLSPTASLFVGGGMAPTSLSITVGALTMTDSNGRLLIGSTEVGAVDYAQGILSISPGGATYSGTKTVVYRPAAGSRDATESASIRVTAENRSQVVTLTLLPIPAPGTLTVDYLALGRWYTLRDQGGGTLKGVDPAFGAGTLSFTTGGIAVTLGALPDVGSEIIYTWGSTASAYPVPVAAATKVGFALSLNSRVVPGSLSFTWEDTAVRTVTDDGAGNLAGDSTGTIDYVTGDIFIMPNAVVPSIGVAWTANFSNAVTPPSPVTSLTMVDVGPQWEANLGGSVKPGTFSATLPLNVPQTESVVGTPTMSSFVSGTLTVTTTFPQQNTGRKIKDNGTGGIVLVYSGTTSDTGTTIGTINYTTGVVRVSKALLGIPHDYPVGWVKTNSVKTYLRAAVSGYASA
ncbi:MAG: hypothetical protein HEQ39_09730 [Rhizobacter sp.]